MNFLTRSFLVVGIIGILAGSVWAREEMRTIHVFVALCDNKYQHIVPVPAKIGNGDDPANNLYWGCGDGVKSHFSHSPDWKLLSSQNSPNQFILERCVFKHTKTNTFLVADAYRGAEIKQATSDFLAAASGSSSGKLKVAWETSSVEIPIKGSAHLVAYIGHNGLMDFELPTPPPRQKSSGNQVIVLCCASEQYFLNRLLQSGAFPLLMTRQLMYPGSFLLKTALDGWLQNETTPQLRERAARAYAANQKISLKAARGIFSPL